MPPKLQTLNLKLVALGCAGLFLFGLIFAYVIFPPILRAILVSQVILKPGTLMRDMYNELPFPLIFKVYLFHVLNPDEVMKGGKPKFEERGPYVFEEWKLKYDQVDDKEEDTIEFTLQNTFIFNKTLSNGLTGNEEIVVAHPLILGMPLTINVDRAPMLPLVAKALEEIFHNPKDIFFRGKVMDILFHGIDVDCTSTDFNAKATCSAFEGGDVKAVTPTDVEDMYKFSLFGAQNATPAGRWKTYRGMKNISDLGRVILYENEPEQDVWDGDECNKIVGTDSTIFPPFMAKEQGIWSFEPAVCRSMGAMYERPSKYGGLPTSHYSLDMGDIAADEKLHCFCDDGECPVKGTMNLFPCVGVPLVASMPHFWNGDESLFEKIESGIEPDKDKHEIFVNFEVISGTPLGAAKRLQINIDLMPLQEIEIMQNVPEMIFPLIWVEEGANLNKTFVNMLKYQLFLGLKARFVVKWLCLLVGFFGGVGAAILEYQKQNSQGNTVVQDVKVFTESESAANINNTNDLDRTNANSASSNFTVHSTDLPEKYRQRTRGHTPLTPNRTIHL